MTVDVPFEDTIILKSGRRVFVRKVNHKERLTCHWYKLTIEGKFILSIL